jgi:hypothetical protein
MYVYHIFLIHLSVLGHVVCFYSLAVVSSAAINMVSPLYPELHSYGTSIFSFLRNLNAAFHNGYTNLHLHQQCIKVPVSLHPCQHLLFLQLKMVILTGEI